MCNVYGISLLAECINFLTFSFHFWTLPRITRKNIIVHIVRRGFDFKLTFHDLSDPCVCQMEFCEKSTLRTCIDTGLYEDMGRAWRLFHEVVDGLVHIHEQGIIHRDLKPVNIFLDVNDQVKIGDFGLATTDIISQLGVSHSCHEVGDGGRLRSRDDRHHITARGESQLS